MTLLDDILMTLAMVLGPIGYFLGSLRREVVYVERPSQVAVSCPTGLSRIEQHAFEKANNPNYRGS